MGAHETWRGNPHVWGSPNSIVLSRWWRSWGSVRGNTRGQFFQGWKLVWKAWEMAGDCARGGGFAWTGKRRARSASSGSGRIDCCTRQGERHHACAASHLVLTELPVHGLCSTPRNGHFLRHFGPHLRFESVVLMLSLAILADLMIFHSLIPYRSYNRASLFFLSSSHSLRRSR